MLIALRLYVLIVLTQAGYIYAAWCVLRRGRRVALSITSSEFADGHSSGGSVMTIRNDMFALDTACLKLCIMLTAVGGATALGADALPLFPEMRVIVMYLLLFAPASTQREVYDKAFSPFLVKLGGVARSVHSSDFLTKRICLFAVRNFVSLSIALMNYVDRCQTLEPDAIKDILGGLVFSRRALDDVAALQKRENENGSPLFIQSIISSFNKNDGKEALQGYAASLAAAAEPTSRDGGALVSVTSSQGVSYESSKPLPVSLFSSVEEGPGYIKEKKRK